MARSQDHALWNMDSARPREAKWPGRKKKKKEDKQLFYLLILDRKETHFRSLPLLYWQSETRGNQPVFGGGGFDDD